MSKRGGEVVPGSEPIGRREALELPDSSALSDAAYLSLARADPLLGSEQQFVKPFNWRALRRLGQTARCRAHRESSLGVASRGDGDVFGRLRRHRQVPKAGMNCRIPLIA